MKASYLVNNATNKLHARLKALDLKDLNISEYYRNYLEKYVDNFAFFMSLYSQLLIKALNKLEKPVNESTFADYGGGCGILSFLARETGFKTVIYNDINKNSVNETQIISAILNIEIDLYICGDVEVFVNEINRRNIKPDLICSFDVLEHIYDLEHWFRKIAEADSRFSLLFMTCANSGNPLVRHRLKKLHTDAEFKGGEKNIRNNDLFLDSSILKERERIIGDKFPDLKLSDIQFLALKTRGLRKDDIEKLVDLFIRTGEFPYIADHPTNTCDPYTGSWVERLIDLQQLKTIIRQSGLNVSISNSYYGYSAGRMLNVPKYILNQMISILGPQNLFFSPAFILETNKS
jgi:hypothetical protein